MKTNIRLLIYRLLTAASMVCAATSIGMTVYFIVCSAGACK